ncbi:hypothetical protein OG2516_17605 [Oceanicola granulosus HTCC2516]|uniref:Ferritin-like domain-containing protein n=1 Tax=Oceanicola granulosus (strain ATCC BAA-861 / DSM 15982 / KCTC 12143 / HTCC2516) TaxID=314256 RepID=Q2CF59_OCEGH|nr:ferritin-like domain-containing protein [Oceanicola granulosus]EAR51268.1 hypothetical protein OG2516_17605 [Oceanicola granulosus HTCC2516]
MLHDLTLTQAMAQTASGPTVSADGVVDLGGGDTGVLNYAYALEQLEAAYYTQVVDNPYSGMTRTERDILADLRDHEIAHRETFRVALGENRIPDLQVDFSAVDFSSRQSVLTTARTFEDLGVAAYNGGGAAIQSPDILVLAGKIVSVEARHAATIRTLLNPGSADFAGDDVVNLLGLDQALPPSEVLAAAAPFIATRVSANQLP